MREGREGDLQGGAEGGVEQQVGAVEVVEDVADLGLAGRGGETGADGWGERLLDGWMRRGRWKER